VKEIPELCERMTSAYRAIPDCVRHGYFHSVTKIRVTELCNAWLCGKTRLKEQNHAGCEQD